MTDRLQNILPKEYREYFESTTQDERYRLSVSVANDSWGTLCYPASYEERRDGWNAEEREAVIQGSKPCPICHDTGVYPRFQIAVAKMKKGDEIISRRIFRKKDEDCDCQMWKHVWNLVKRGLPPTYQQFSLATLKPDLASRLPMDRQQEEIEYIRQHESESFLLLGPSGTGKTTFAYALFRAAYERDARRFWSEDLKGIEYGNSRWIWRGNFNDLLNQFNAKQRDNEGTVPDPEVTQQKIKNVARDGYTPVLIIEEIDKLNLNSHRINFLFHLIDEIINAKGQLILTTNLTFPELRATLTANDEIKITGETILRRLTTERVNIRNYFQ